MPFFEKFPAQEARRSRVLHGSADIMRGQVYVLERTEETQGEKVTAALMRECEFSFIQKIPFKSFPQNIKNTHNPTHIHSEHMYTQLWGKFFLIIKYDEPGE